MTAAKKPARKAAAKRKKANGRPPYKTTEAHKKVIIAMASFGIPHEDIATSIGIDAKTMRKYYPDELGASATNANAKIAESLYNNATSGNVTAQIWWTKARMGWKETARQEHTGRGGGPIQTVDAEALAGLSDKELEILEGISAKLGDPAPSDDQG